MLGVTALAVIAWVVPAGAGQGPAVLEGEVSCVAGTYEVTWTVTVQGLPDGAEADLIDIELSGAASGTVTFTPNPIPGVTGELVSSTGTTALPGSTVGDVTLDLVSVYISPQPATATVTLDGTCVAPEPPPTPVEAEARFTG
jgi:hypothetical protein